MEKRSEIDIYAGDYESVNKKLHEIKKIFQKVENIVSKQILYTIIPDIEREASLESIKNKQKSRKDRIEMLKNVRSQLVYIKDIAVFMSYILRAKKTLKTVRGIDENDIVSDKNVSQNYSKQLKYGIRRNKEHISQSVESIKGLYGDNKQFIAGSKQRKQNIKKLIDDAHALQNFYDIQMGKVYECIDMIDQKIIKLAKDYSSGKLILEKHEDYKPDFYLLDEELDPFIKQLIDSILTTPENQIVIQYGEVKENIINIADYLGKSDKTNQNIINIADYFNRSHKTK